MMNLPNRWKPLVRSQCVLIVVSLSMVSSQLIAGSSERSLFRSEGTAGDRSWQAVNDGVMGGRSDGRFKVDENGRMFFFGTLSLANNGGFASVRSRGANLNLKPGDVIVARVRGDGREYSLNLYTPGRRLAFSYRAHFQTEKDQWCEVRLPMETFVATSFGRPLPSQTLDPTTVNGLGILLGDKQAGPFKLEIDWIRASRSND